MIVPVDDRNRGLWRFSKAAGSGSRRPSAWGRTVMRARRAGARGAVRFKGTGVVAGGPQAAQGRPAARDPRRQAPDPALARALRSPDRALEQGGARRGRPPAGAALSGPRAGGGRRGGAVAVTRAARCVLVCCWPADRRGGRRRRSAGRADGGVPRRQGGDQAWSRSRPASVSARRRCAAGGERRWRRWCAATSGGSAQDFGSCSRRPRDGAGLFVSGSATTAIAGRTAGCTRSAGAPPARARPIPLAPSGTAGWAGAAGDLVLLPAEPAAASGRWSWPRWPAGRGAATVRGYDDEAPARPWRARPSSAAA